MDTAILRRLLEGHELSAVEAESFMGTIMDGDLCAASLGAALAALKFRGVTSAELGGFARAMRARCVPVEASAASRAVDTCGTGGDGRDTFNISTAAALVTAAAGVPVAKHGNRAASSRCGSADVLEALGVTLTADAPALGRILDEVGIAFLFAPNHHPAMRHAMPTRRALGVRTVFNLLGPLANPAGVRRQLLGVYAPRLCGLMAEALRDLGAERALVVHGRDGQDEFSLTGETMITELQDGRLHHRSVRPEDLGLTRCRAEDLIGGDARENADLVLATLRGEPGPRTEAVLFNAAGALVAAGAASDLSEAVTMAREAVGDGRGAGLLERLVEASGDLGRQAAGGDA